MIYHAVKYERRVRKAGRPLRDLVGRFSGRELPVGPAWARSLHVPARGAETGVALLLEAPDLNYGVVLVVGGAEHVSRRGYWWAVWARVGP